ncbi:DUF5682 family protein [Providencia burhodogranariea]|uniref:4-aminobutyrate aminotransferase n=1 Tax=Providencia burhodogranariea DSM 19968 TaxID=1141662 RepID=K8X030_9GAMM|nr:DUF5682 family protein [Providencia burhodogranariea]EKT62982.1 hypothetical protein OOA_05881 [Providencia burhodogranariea DSM 19968]
MSLPSIELPERLSSALEKIRALQENQLYFAPVRHHSPACAYSVLTLIETIAPDYILIEGPDSFDSLISGLVDGETKPPIAIMGQTDVKRQSDSESDAVTKSAYFPFCEYSPEWQALQVGHKQKAKLKFIDLPWSAQVELDENRENQHQSLQTERYLAHSLFISQLAKKCGCRDHDELWEHLFELRTQEALTDWHSLFHDTFIWCALARLDYEPQVLEAEGSSQREAHMLAHIQTIKQAEPDAKIVIVTGGFHTLPLVEGLTEAIPQGFALSTTQQKQFKQKQLLQQKDSAWLIRYSYDRLDALNGYASGMPSPAFYQRVWESLLAKRHDMQISSMPIKPTQYYRNQLGITFLSNVANVLNDKQFDAAPGFLSVKLAAEQSLRLAAFRGHIGPGRYDLLDGLQSAFIKGSLDESQDELWHEIKTCFSGFLLGQIPKGTVTPPLVAETYETAKGYRFKLDDTLSKNSRLDVYRNPQHRLRSRFLHLLDFLEIHFARRISGPDFLSGHQMDLLFEEWKYAWTPNVEGELIALSEKGTRLKTIALDKLLQMEKQLEDQGFSRSSQNAVKLLIQAALIGLTQQLPALFNLLDRYIQQDSKLDSLVACGHKLIHLWRGRQLFDIDEAFSIEDRLHLVIQQVFYCLDQLTQSDEQQQEQSFEALLSCRELVAFMPEISPNSNYLNEFHQQLNRLDGQLNHVPLLKGAVDALRYLGGKIDESVLTIEVQRSFSAGSDPEIAVGYFIGVMRAAPELVIRMPLLVDLLNQLLSQWDEQRFIQVLPDLRFAFSQLTPKLNAQMAHYIAQELAIDSQQLTLHQTEFSEKQLLDALRIEQKLLSQLTEQGLQGWFDELKDVANYE